MQNITKPRTVSFEEALRNLASRLTGVAVADLPRTQETIVQFMAEHVPSVDDLAEAVTKEVMTRLSAAQAQPENSGNDEAPTDEADTNNEAQEPKKKGSKAKTTE
jgi:hypothetical protein